MITEWPERNLGNSGCDCCVISTCDVYYTSPWQIKEQLNRPSKAVGATEVGDTYQITIHANSGE